MTRIWIYAWFFCFCLFAGVSHAAPVAVRSGAHDGFSRLVLDVPTNTEWSLENNNGWARIELQGHKDGFDVSRVFDRIDQSHVASLNSGKDFLEIRFACACTSKAFRQGKQMIVLDVSPRTDLQETQEPVKSGFPLLPSVSEAFRFSNGIALNSALGDGFDKASADQSQPKTSTDKTNTAIEPSHGANISEPSDLNHIQERIARQVGQAATRGLLTPKRNALHLPIVQSQPQIDPRVFDSSSAQLDLDAAESTPGGDNIRITSSSDIPTGQMRMMASTTQGFQCIDPSVIAIDKWATDEPFGTQIATVRKQLYSEFDKLDHRSAIQLARVYLHFGFGAEAREVLLLDDQLGADNPALIELADIMDYGHSKTPQYLHHFMECDTDVAFWAVLSKPFIAPGEMVNTEAALRAVTALPMHLRSFLAPELSRRLLEYGEPQAAAAALRSLERAAEPLSPDAHIAKADIELAQGKVSDAQEHLAEVVSSNTELSAEALIKYVESHLDADDQIEQDVATLVEAYALQMRDDPIGAELQRTLVLAYGKSGQFDAAFGALQRLRDRDASLVDASLESAIVSILTRNGTDIEFLDHAFRELPISQEMLDKSTILEAADRLVRLGFATRAEQVLQRRPDVTDQKDARLVQAKIALFLARPFEAQALVFGIETEEANAIRAKAKSETGAYEAAHALFSEIGAEDRAMEAAWLSEDWTSLITAESDFFGPVAEVARTPISDDAELSGMLTRTSAAIAESAQARSVLEELLRSSNPDATSQP